MKPATGVLIGTVAQIEWAERIRPLVNAEFDRVAQALSAAAIDRSEQVRADVATALEILEQKRFEVMASEHAGYFIHDWQEVNDQVRQMIRHDPRYQAIQARKATQRIQPD
jgi:hypothetical protein